MNEASQRRQTSMEMEGGHGGERGADARGSRFISPEDGYKWRKYGQKFIKYIGKNRSYFNCQRSNCPARKKVEWSILKTGSVRVVYEAVHKHASPTIESTASQSQTPTSSANQYDLWTQVFRNQPTSCHDNEQVFKYQSTSEYDNEQLFKNLSTSHRDNKN